MRVPRSSFPWPALLGAMLLAGCGNGAEESTPEITPTEPPTTAGDPSHPEDPPGARRDTHEALRESAAAPRSPADGGGRAWLEAEDGVPPPATVGQPGTWTIVYEAGPLGVAEGGFVRLTVSAFWGWSTPQVHSPQAPGHCTVETTAEGVELRTAARDWLDMVVAGRALAPGERIRIVYGAGPAGARADRFAEADSRFWISVDGDGDGVPGVLVASPGIPVRPGPPALLRLTLPSTAHPGDTVFLRAAILDGLGNRGVPWSGELQLEAPGPGLELPASIPFRAEDAGVRAIEVKILESGVHRVLGTTAATEEGEESEPALAALSNPLLVAEQNARILWGDLHGHSGLSDGTGTPEEYLSYARDVAGLDVIALTDHDHWGMLPLDQFPDLFAEIRAVTERFHDPGTFVTLLGYEWTSWIHGHRHVLYFEGEGEVLSSIDERYETPAQLWEGLRGRKAMTFAHHSAGGPIPTNWEYRPDPEFEPVTEIVSVHGCSESPDAPRPIYSPQAGNFVRDVLDRGFRLGFVGSGDSHDGHPGFADISSGGQGTGLAAILTEDLSRDGVHTALFARRSYASNGPRMVLRTALDGHRMGEVVPLPAPGQPAVLYVRVIPETPLAFVDVVRRGGTVRNELPEGAWEFEDLLELSDLAAGEYVYVRAVQRDGGAVWSSPFFLGE